MHGWLMYTHVVMERCCRISKGHAMCFTVGRGSSCPLDVSTPGIPAAQHILPQQRLLADEAAWEPVLAMLRDEEVAEKLRGRWRRDQGRLTTGDISLERWQELEAEVDKARLCQHAWPLSSTQPEIPYAQIDA